MLSILKFHKVEKYKKYRQERQEARQRKIWWKEVGEVGNAPENLQFNSWKWWFLNYDVHIDWFE